MRFHCDVQCAAVSCSSVRRAGEVGDPISLTILKHFLRSWFPDVATLSSWNAKSETIEKPSTAE